MVLPHIRINIGMVIVTFLLHHNILDVFIFEEFLEFGPGDFDEPVFVEVVGVVEGDGEGDGGNYPADVFAEWGVGIGGLGIGLEVKIGLVGGDGLLLRLFEVGGFEELEALGWRDEGAQEAVGEDEGVEGRLEGGAQL